MLIYVYNKDKEVVEKIDTSDFDVKKHFHRDTKESFSKKDLENLGIKS